MSFVLSYDYSQRDSFNETNVMMLTDVPSHDVTTTKWLLMEIHHTVS